MSPTARTARRPRRPANPEPEDDNFEDDNDDTEDRTSRRSSSRPARRSAPRAQAADDDEDDRPRRGRGRSRDEDDGDEGSDDETSNAVGAGWGTWREKKAEAGGFADEFKVPEYKTKYLIMFLNNKPFATYSEHWIDEMPKGKKKSYICIGKANGCPLCKALGEKPSARAMFNVVEFIEDGEGGREGVLKVWTCGSGIVQQIEEHLEENDGPGLEENYFVISKTKSGRNGPTTYNVVHIKERDLGDKPWEMDPLEQDEIDEFHEKEYDKGYLKVPSKKSLQDVADEVMSWD